MITGRRNTLYGPQREMTRENCKSICTKDSVRDALQKGEYGGDSDVWLTSAKGSYQGEAQFDLKSKQQQSRDTTNFVLGFDKVTYLTTTQDYKSHEVKDKPKHETCDMDKSHIPDFCPEYLECRKTEPSEYQVSFTRDSDNPVATSIASEDRKKHTNDLRSTHFQLGSCSEPKSSETNHFFCELTKKEQPKMIGALERSKSTVFRPGDWNETDYKMLPKSITQKDFDKPEKTRLEDENEIQVPSVTWQRKTHFQLGSDEGMNDSIYSKDFITSPNLTTSKPVLATGPPSSLVIPNDTDTSFESTLQSNFGNCDRTVMLEMKQERNKSCIENKNRQTDISAPISSSSMVPQKLMSTTTCHFHQPLKNEVNNPNPLSVNSEYNHLTSDYNGQETKFSETKASYITAPIASKELRDECLRKFKDNKSTHFVFGNDDLIDIVSEQASQYRQHLPIDPSVRAAGKSHPEKKRYHHMDGIGGQYIPRQIIKQTDSNIDIQSTSVMKRDYQPVYDSKIREEIPLNTVATHFFHMDNDFQGTRNSTTKTDFLPPPEIL